MNLFSSEFESSLSNLIGKILAQQLSTLPLQSKKVSDNTTEEYWTRKQAAKELSICITTLHNYVKHGKIKTHRIGNRVLIKRKDLEASISPTVYK